MGAGKIVLLIIGIIVLLVALGFMAAGGFLVWLDTARADSEGFVSTRTVHLERTSYAIVTEPVELHVDAWFWDWSDLGSIKVEGSNNDSSKQMFMGIARETELNSYLRDVEYDEITDFGFLSSDVDYESHPGSSAPAAPIVHSFWIAFADGAGTQTLEWELEEGTFSLVLMNSDGSSGIDLDVKVMVKINHIFKIGVGLLAGGFVLLIGGTLMVFFAVRRS